MQINFPLPNYLKEFRNCFSDIGCLPGKHHNVIDTNHPPDVNPPLPPKKRIPYVHPTAEDILSQMSGAKYFTKLDASNAYRQIELDEESSKLLTFNSPFGCYQFLRCHMEYIPLVMYVDRKIAQIIDGIDGATNSQDEIIIWGNIQQELESRTMKVFSSVKNNGLKLNRSKSQFNKSEVIFWDNQRYIS